MTSTSVADKHNIRDEIVHLAVPVGGLTPFPGNARRGNVAVVTDSLKAHGQYKPVLARRSDSMIIAGHHMVKAAETLGWTHVAVQFIDVDDEQASRINAADNRTSDLGGYDTAALIEQLQALPDLSGTGYDAGDLDELLATITVLPAALTNPDDAPEAPEEPVTKPGDLILLGRHRLLCGDCTILTDIERLMNGRDADMVWTDPPYGVAYVGKTKNALTIENDSLDDSSLEQFLRDALGNAWAVSEEGAAWYVAAPPGPLHLAFAIVLHELDVWRQTLIWQKDVFVLGHSDYHYRHEPIFYGWKPGSPHYITDDRTQDSVWEIPRPKRSEDHPTMKPVDLIARAIRNSSKPGWIVLDPFAGSGSTLIAAEQEGRTAYLMEIDPRYADVIVRRWEEYTGLRAERPKSAIPA